MAPVIWGLDLKDIHWRKFGSDYMWKNKDYHMRRTKFVIYQLAMICMVVSESIGTAALTDYVKQQSRIESLHSSASVHNDDFVGVASYNIFCGVAVATVFGAAFFFDLFFPERFEPRNIRWSWRLSAVFVTLCTIGDALAFTVVVATGKSWISADTEDQEQIAQEKINPPLVYRHNGRAIAATVFLWLGLCATVASCIILWLYYQHHDTYGPKSHTARMRDEVDKTILINERARTGMSSREQMAEQMAFQSM
ncbi:uncharacterized protein Z520_09872 [Fonsecaea multimorphosa CBS 102226]|uniref:MARVEL domain-containing protein n=1 Tax=Fonsecaea multimorphosa CBS 102226 TaxID=1442371 RepID=A0A0D2IBG6_9EURO|nr:uncharacterized protein Z520_09872 [Fonsecaea multimorphosa CBS 102226]KIX94486.1 hypothetical protein Z520_09872 [Fonsecaea multimorphosa CBS 102226]OAL20064.1 hypothetical protein AYO22_09214 [Fonsecaea multimorphosa]